MISVSDKTRNKLHLNNKALILLIQNYKKYSLTKLILYRKISLVKKWWKIYSCKFFTSVAPKKIAIQDIILV